MIEIVQSEIHIELEASPKGPIEKDAFCFLKIINSYEIVS